MESIYHFLSQKLFVFGESPVTVAQALAVPAVIVLTLLLARWLERRFSRSLQQKSYDANLIQLLRRGFYAVVITTLVFVTLGLLHVPLGALTFISGAIAIGVGFGAQNVINNFISGWILMGEQPIRIGDMLELDGTLGTVEAINTRSTRIRRLDGVRIVVPNSFLLENTVINWNLVDNEIRAFIQVGVEYGSPVRTVETLLQQAAREQKDVLNKPQPTVLFQDFGDNALIFELYYWTQVKQGSDFRKLRSDIRFRVEELFRENGVTIAFPQRDIHLDGSLRLFEERRAAAAASEPPAADEEQDLAG